MHPDVVDQAVARAASPAPGRRGIIARGLGRSYGDAAQNAGGSVLDATWLDAIHEVDLESGQVTVGAGVSLQTLMERLVPLGWFVPGDPRAPDWSPSGGPSPPTSTARTTTWTAASAPTSSR